MNDIIIISIIIIIIIIPSFVTQEKWSGNVPPRHSKLTLFKTKLVHIATLVRRTVADTSYFKLQQIVQDYMQTRLKERETGYLFA